MEDTITNSKSYRLSFHGNGSEYFGIVVVNWLLTMLTLGIYYPWAKAKQLSYIYSSIALNDDKFSFHGTGNEMFKGFVKTIGIILVIYGLLMLFIFLQLPMIGILIFYLGILAIMPLAIHGSYRYRMSRTSWRGIRFGYRGNRNEFIKKFFTWIFLTIITFGIYSAWFSMNLRNYLLSNVRFGNIEFKYKGNGGDFFILNLKGYFLSVITLGIYSFWWQKDLFAYYVDNLSLHKDEEQIKFKSVATGSDFFKLMIVNLLIIVFTLGLGYAWVVTRTLNLIVSKIQLDGNIDIDLIAQTEEDYKDALGDDMNDFLNIDFVM